MSGHSKWSTIKHQKGTTDRARGQLFTKLGNAITIAVREGGGSASPEDNIRLRLAIEKARAANMPKENITRAIDRATGKLAGSTQLETVIYEGFAPFGVALLVSAVTDNKQRAAAAIKNLLSTHGGSLGGVGSVAYLFEKMGMLQLASAGSGVLDMVLESGAVDFEEAAGLLTVYTNPTDLHRVKLFLEQKNVSVRTNEILYRPKTVVTLTEIANQQRVLTLLEALDALDDVHEVYTNAEFVAKTTV